MSINPCIHNQLAELINQAAKLNESESDDVSETDALKEALSLAISRIPKHSLPLFMSEVQKAPCFEHVLNKTIDGSSKIKELKSLLSDNVFIEKPNYYSYKDVNGEITKDGHTMMTFDIVKDLNRKSSLEELKFDLIDSKIDKRVIVEHLSPFNESSRVEVNINGLSQRLIKKLLPDFRTGNQPLLYPVKKPLIEKFYIANRKENKRIKFSNHKK